MARRKIIVKGKLERQLLKNKKCIFKFKILKLSTEKKPNKGLYAHYFSKLKHQFNLNKQALRYLRRYPSLFPVGKKGKVFAVNRAYLRFLAPKPYLYSLRRYWPIPPLRITLPVHYEIPVGEYGKICIKKRQEFSLLYPENCSPLKRKASIKLKNTPSSFFSKHFHRLVDFSYDLRDHLEDDLHYRDPSTSLSVDAYLVLHVQVKHNNIVCHLTNNTGHTMFQAKTGPSYGIKMSKVNIRSSLEIFLSSYAKDLLESVKTGQNKERILKCLNNDILFNIKAPRKYRKKIMSLCKSFIFKNTFLYEASGRDFGERQTFSNPSSLLDFKGAGVFINIVDNKAYNGCRVRSLVRKKRRSRGKVYKYKFTRR